MLWMIYLNWSSEISFSVNPSETSVHFSIIVPYRNEAKNLPDLIQSFEALDYPQNLFEVIFVDDASDDDFDFGKRNFVYQKICIQSKSVSPKKEAIAKGIEICNSNWIITTDADCVVPKNWLKKLSNLVNQTNAKMIVMPVKMKWQNGLIGAMQYFEFMALQAVTKASFLAKRGFMCNGANFAYQKAFFKEIKGFEGNENWASGDDVFLLQKALKASPENVQCCFDSELMVETKSLDSWKQVWHQKKRWASKSSAYKMRFPQIMGAVVALSNVIFVIALFAVWLNPFLLCVLVTKIIIDWLMIQSVSKDSNLKMWYWFTLASFLYPFFNALIVFSLISKKYEWKNRILE